MNYKLNAYLDPVSQYEYSENPNQFKNYGPYSLQKSRLFCENKPRLNKSQSDIDVSKIKLKQYIDETILKPNNLYLQSDLKTFRNKNQVNHKNRLLFNFESKDLPDYLKVYDKSGVKAIDDYYATQNKNLSMFSKFNYWITVDPKSRDRKHYLEKEKQDLRYESKVAPEWMQVNPKVRAPNLFKAIQRKNTMKDNTKATFLIDRNQNEVLPNYMINAYQREKFQKNN